ncbi:MAG: hydroxyacid dehydrogenase [Anaerolineales bacterium]
MKWNILITDGLEGNGQAILRAQAQVDDRSGISAEELRAILPAYDALIVRGRTRVTADLLSQAPRLKVIGRAGVGVDNIDLEAARKQGIIVVNAPLATTVAVAELTFGLLLAMARDIPRADAAMKQGKWLKKELEGVELQGKTLGLIGFGRIGREVAHRALAFGMHILAYDPLIPEDVIRQANATPCALDELLRRSDFVSIHVPLTEETRNLLDAAAFAKMKPGLRLVCTARGGIVDESALLQALKDGRVAAAALDVFAQEPPGASELICHPSVIATPHIGAQTVEAQARAAEMIAQEVMAALRNEPLRWRVV